MHNVVIFAKRPGKFCDRSSMMAQTLMAFSYHFYVGLKQIFETAMRGHRFGYLINCQTHARPENQKDAECHITCVKSQTLDKELLLLSVAFGKT
jgi:hypothetical protein